MADSSAQPPQGHSLPQLSRSRASGGAVPGFSHFTQQPRYQQLVGVPQCFDIKFTRPTVSLGLRAEGNRGPRSTQLFSGAAACECSEPPGPLRAH
eukprot:1157760-Pelagomonas_calceolata.AAC.1